MTLWTAPPRVLVQPMVPPTSTTRTLAVPQRTVAARGPRAADQADDPVVSMSGLAGSRAKRPSER